MHASVLSQLFELLAGLLAGAGAAVLVLPFSFLRQMLPHLPVLWDAAFSALAGFGLFAAAQWLSGGLRPVFLLMAGLGAAGTWRLLSPLRRAAERQFARIRAWRAASDRERKKRERSARKKDEKN